MGTSWSIWIAAKDRLWWFGDLCGNSRRNGKYWVSLLKKSPAATLHHRPWWNWAVQTMPNSAFSGICSCLLCSFFQCLLAKVIVFCQLLWINLKIFKTNERKEQKSNDETYNRELVNVWTELWLRYASYAILTKSRLTSWNFLFYAFSSLQIVEVEIKVLKPMENAKARTTVWSLRVLTLRLKLKSRLKHKSFPKSCLSYDMFKQHT